MKRDGAGRPAALTLAALALGCGAWGCGQGAATTATDPERALAALEQELLAAPETRIGFRVTSEGAFAAELAGELLLGAEGRLALQAQGSFGGEAVSLWLQVADGLMEGGHGDRTFREPAPAGVREAMVIGFTRMGLLHNLARLVAGLPPDRADGPVRSWVEAREPAWVEGREPARVEDAGEEAGLRGLTFAIWVGGQEAGVATLWLDGEGRLRSRDQTVSFPGGEMQVREEHQIR